MRFFLKIYFLIFYLIISATENFAQNVSKSNQVKTGFIEMTGPTDPINLNKLRSKKSGI